MPKPRRRWPSPSRSPAKGALPPPSQVDWRTSLKARYRRRGWFATFWLVVLIATCIALSGLAGWGWMLIFGDDPPWDLIGGTLFLAETPVFLWLIRQGPPAAMPGESPEAIAADQFFHDRGQR